ncbi:hypothetical protein FPV67DRAFT_1504448 [Lyophyllum atratum]|nr:hypothetical protein FPV67DRAFT_1504448 [Lyophyllum atratum]
MGVVRRGGGGKLFLSFLALVLSRSFCLVHLRVWGCGMPFVWAAHFCICAFSLHRGRCGGDGDHDHDAMTRACHSRGLVLPCPRPLVPVPGCLASFPFAPSLPPSQPPTHTNPPPLQQAHPTPPPTPPRCSGAG